MSILGEHGKGVRHQAAIRYMPNDALPGTLDAARF